MLKSMTGFGKADTITSVGKFTVEIRSVNGKNADINLKTQFIPREKEIETKQLLSAMLSRGSIDLYISLESSVENTGKHLNREIFKTYWSQIEQLASDMNIPVSKEDLLPIVLKMPDVTEPRKPLETESFWSDLSDCIKRAALAMDEFRSSEGAKLEIEIRERINNILSSLSLTEKLDSSRNESVRNKLLSRFEESGLTADQNRFEQEIIYYLEKLDITEEKVRLKQHCEYFIQTIKTESMPGKKLGFIAQEIGREINTLGSKANHAEIQRLVVEMKEELEKIKEQTLNIL